MVTPFYIYNELLELLGGIIPEGDVLEKRTLVLKIQNSQVYHTRLSLISKCNVSYARSKGLVMMRLNVNL